MHGVGTVTRVFFFKSGRQKNISSNTAQQKEIIESNVM